MEAFQSLIEGFGVALQPQNLGFALAGCLLGMVVGVLPGVGPITGIAVLLPITFYLDPTGAIIMLAAIYYGAMYGGTITTVLLNVPGEGSSAVTAIDGYQMARQGRAGAALGIAAVGSFVGGTVATLVIVVAAPPLASVALEFGPPEMFALLVLGLCLLVGLGGRSPLLSLLSGVLGLALVIPGTDPVLGTPRLTFGSIEMLDGLNFVPIIMGLFGLSEILYNAHSRVREERPDVKASARVSSRDLKDSAGAIARGTAVGTTLGVVPGIGTTAPTLMSYALERKVSRHPGRFGQGAIQGVAGPETTNNAYANSAMIPLFTLGIPASPTIAILLGAFMINGITPGPNLFSDEPDLVWGVIASLFIGNAMLLLLNLPLIRIWVAILRVPYAVLFPVVLAFMVIGSYSIRSSIFDVWVLLAFGLLGYGFKLIGFPVVPIALTIILGPLLENALRGSMAISGSDPGIFFRGPISSTILAVAALVLASPLLSPLLAARRRVRQRGDDGPSGGVREDENTADVASQVPSRHDNSPHPTDRESI